MQKYKIVNDRIAAGRVEFLYVRRMTSYWSSAVSSHLWAVRTSIIKEINFTHQGYDDLNLSICPNCFVACYRV